jgi:hypothetical protein
MHSPFGRDRRAVPQRGWRTQPRVSTLGTATPKRRAPKGRQIERTNNAKVGPIEHVSIAHSNFGSNGCELYQISLSPLQHLQPGEPGVFHGTHIHVPCEGELAYFEGSQG